MIFLNHDSSFFVANSSSVDLLITDEFADVKAINEMTEAGLQVIQVNINHDIFKN